MPPLVKLDNISYEDWIQCLHERFGRCIVKQETNKKGGFLAYKKIEGRMKPVSRYNRILKKCVFVDRRSTVRDLTQTNNGFGIFSEEE